MHILSSSCHTFLLSLLKIKFVLNRNGYAWFDFFIMASLLLKIGIRVKKKKRRIEKKMEVKNTERERE